MVNRMQSVPVGEDDDFNFDGGVSIIVSLLVEKKQRYFEARASIAPYIIKPSPV